MNSSLKGLYGRNISNEWDYLIQIKIRGDQKVAKQNPEEYEPWQQALMCAVGQKCDWTDRAYLNPILEYIGISR